MSVTSVTEKFAGRSATQDQLWKRTYVGDGQWSRAARS